MAGRRLRERKIDCILDRTRLHHLRRLGELQQRAPIRKRRCTDFDELRLSSRFVGADDSDRPLASAAQAAPAGTGRSLVAGVVLHAGRIDRAYLLCAEWYAEQDIARCRAGLLPAGGTGVYVGFGRSPSLAKGEIAVHLAERRAAAGDEYALRHAYL